ncbi:L,D-transpeptidase family protein [Streptomyces sp. NRRL F-2747]|uniref:L,D-transpeptidase family protein n=1 Tax=Streptomyces sp. NRRL F-2747 TaxID=1463843 RepID=UPI00099B7D21|nr:L,D-transpeptidase family protein [Streptomyces sp. NRRL F-2747]
MSKHPRAGSRTPRTFLTSLTSLTSVTSRSLRSPRRLAVAAAVGLLACGAGWVYAAQEDDPVTSASARTGDRPGDAARRPSSGAASDAAASDAAPAGGGTHATRGARGAPGAPGAPAASGAAGAPGAPGAPAAPDSAGGLSEVSEETRARIPADTRQLLLVAGKARDSSESTATLYTRPAAGADWVRSSESWPAHNGASGWNSGEREDGDLTTPVGVFTLRDAGGLLEKPQGTKFPYDHNRLFVPTGRGVNGESLAGAFEYVIAIDYNRRTGFSPLDLVKPEGEDKGGGIWLHVDHNGPSQGCIGISKEAMKKLLTTLDPAAKPVVVMGPEGF